MSNSKISIYSNNNLNTYNDYSSIKNEQESPISVFDDNTNFDMDIGERFFRQSDNSDAPLKHKSGNGAENGSNIPKYSDIKGDENLPSQMIEYIKSLNTGEHKNKTLQIGNYWYRFGVNGNVERVYNHKPQDNINDEKDSFTYLIYGSDNKIEKILMYEKEGVKDKNGTRRCNYYSSNGEYHGYYIETNGKTEKDVWLNPEFNPMIDKVKNDNISMPELEAYLSEDIYNEKVEQENSYDAKDNLYLFMRNYEQKTGETLLEKLSKTADGEKLCKTIINEIVKNNKDNKYLDDIVSDIKSHPKDYKKLSIDIERILERQDVYAKNETLRLNGKINEPTEQGVTGDCYLLSTVSALDATQRGHKALTGLWKYNAHNDIEFTCKGNNKTYTITRDQIKKSDHLSLGDDDMRIYEIAMDMYRRDMAYDNPDEPVSVEGGTMSEVMHAFFGIDYNSTITDPEELTKTDFTQKAYNFHIDLNGANLSVKNVKGETVHDGLINDHQYQVKEVKDGNIYFVNPWDNQNTLVMPFEQFKTLHPSFEVIDLTMLPEGN